MKTMLTNRIAIMLKSLNILLLVVVVCGCVSTASAAYQTWTNDVWPLDNNGNPIMAQAGGITKVGNTYYWYGIQYPADASYYNSQTGNSIASGHGINCYSSTDLVHWTFVNTLTTHQSTGRMGEIAYNSADNQYVIWANNGDGTPWCYTGSTLTGSYSFYGSQAVVTNEYTGGGTQITGDCTLFIDDDNGGTPYFITSDPHGRQHAYVCPLSADYLTIGNAVPINDTAGVPAWPQGQEANNVFERNGIYYYITSDLAGYSYSAGYAVWSTNLLSATSYTPDAYFQGTTADYTRYSQVSFGFRVAGTQATNYIYVGDRWCEEDSTYASAGYGNGFSVMCPLTFTNGVPYFNSVHEFQVDTVTGKIRPATIADIPTNLTATASEGQTPGQVTLSWAAVDGADAYNVYRSTTNGGPYAALATATTNNYTDTGLQNGTTYFYVVTSTNVFGESAASAPASATPSIGPLITAASASPVPVFPGGIVTINATVTAQANPIGAVTVDASALGGANNQTLVSDGAGDYTNSITVSPTTLDGDQPLTINAADNLGNIASPYPFSAIVGSASLTWNGGGPDENWSDAANWDGGVAPGPGSSLDFGGQTGLAPLMDNSYNVYAMNFDGTAGAFTIGASGNTLTLTSALTNDSANPQILNLPVVLGAAVTLNAATADLTLGQAVTNGGNLLTITDGGHNTTVSGAMSGTGGLAKNGPGTNTLSGVNTFGGNLAISNGTVVVAGAGQLGGGAYSGTVADNGTFTYSSTAAQTLSGIISGIGSLNENGSGPLALFAANTFSGPTTVSGGTLQVSNTLALQDSVLNCNGGTVTFGGITAATLGGLSGTQDLSLLNGSSVAVALTVGGDNANTTYSGNLFGSGSLAVIGKGTLTLANANFTGNVTVGTAGSTGGAAGMFTIIGGTFGSSSSTLSINADGDATAFIMNGGSATFKTVNVATASNETGGGMEITGGTANFSVTTTGGNPANISGGDSSGPLTITGGTVNLGSAFIGRLSGLVINGSGAVVTATNLNVTSNAGPANHNAPVTLTSGSLTIGTSVSTGAFEMGTTSGDGTNLLTMSGGTLTYFGTDGLQLGSYTLVNISGGTANLSGITVDSANGGNGNSKLNVTGGTLYLGGVGLVVNSPSASDYAQFGSATVGAITDWSSTAPITLSGTTTFQAADASSVAHNISLGGALSGTGNLAKTGGGTLTLSGTNTYGGSTTISGGLLLVTNTARSATGSGAVMVNSGGTLGGNGIVAGAVTVNSGGALTPGNPLGTLTISNNLTLAAGSTTFMQIQHSPPANSAVNVTGTLTEGGSLIVSNISVTALASGDSFQLFNAASFNGSFASAVLPSLPAGLGWNTNALSANGVISVVVTARPTIATAVLSGSGFTFAGTGGVANANFYLLGTTNMASPLTNWTVLLTNQFDGNGNFSFTNPAGKNMQAFYLLQLQ